MLKLIWAYRFFIVSSILTEFRSRFVRSKLGGAWMVLHPLAQVAIYALVLSTVMSAKLPGIDNRYAYAIYLMAGTLGWSLFTEVLGRSVNIFIDNGNLLKKVMFPKIALPLIVVGSSTISNLLLFAAIILVFGLLGHIPGIMILWVPVLMMITLLLAAGLGLTLGILNVFIRDVGQVVPIVLQFWFWLTPVVYSTQIIPAKYLDLLMINPMASVVMGYHDVLVYDKAPEMTTLIYPTVLALAGLALALVMYRGASEEMADVL
jgi:lipopolysaccharide transport system permease protein